MKKLTYYMLTFMALISCTNNNHEIKCYENENNKTCLEYKNHQLIDSVTYVNGKVEGIRKSVDYGDSIIAINTYLEGRLNGISKGFYLNGRNYYSGLYQNDNKIGEWYQWKKNEEIERYDYYNLNGQRLFLVINSNKSYKVTGNPIIHVHFFIDNDSLETSVLVANPSKISSNRIFVGEIDSLGKPRNVLIYNITNSSPAIIEKRLYNNKNKMRIFYELKLNKSDNSFNFKKDFGPVEIDSIATHTAVLRPSAPRLR